MFYFKRWIFQYLRCVLSLELLPLILWETWVSRWYLCVHVMLVVPSPHYSALSYWGDVLVGYIIHQSSGSLNSLQNTPLFEIFPILSCHSLDRCIICFITGALEHGLSIPYFIQYYYLHRNIWYWSFHILLIKRGVY